MPQSLVQIYIHVVFSTKNRHAFLRDAGIREEMHRYLGGICRNLGCPAVEVGGVEDHVHILCRLGKTLAVSELVKEQERASSIWAKGKAPAMAAFQWQAGYGAFSVSPADVEALVADIANQEEHHRTETFQDELRRLFRAHGIEWDERYVWD